MKRIGIAASKIAKGNLILYNFFVILISFLFSIFLFLIAASSILIALIVIAVIVKGFVPVEWQKNWTFALTVCMVTLTIVIGIFNAIAISTNIKLKRVSLNHISNEHDS